MEESPSLLRRREGSGYGIFEIDWRSRHCLQRYIIVLCEVATSGVGLDAIDSLDCTLTRVLVETYSEVA